MDSCNGSTILTALNTVMLEGVTHAPPHSTQNAEDTGPRMPQRNVHAGRMMTRPQAGARVRGWIQVVEEDTGMRVQRRDLNNRRSGVWARVGQ